MSNQYDQHCLHAGCAIPIALYPGYDAIRANTSNVELIAKNTGIKPSNIEKVKNHLFHNKHLLDCYVDYGVPAQMGRFDSKLHLKTSIRN